MSEEMQHYCLNCGGLLTSSDDEWLKCRYCGCTFENLSMQRRAKNMQAILDQAKLEFVNNQRRNLYDAVHAKYISTAEIRQYATEIKKHLPDDFQANFYLQVTSGDVREINQAIREIDVETNYDSLPAVLHLLIASLQTEYLLELNNLVERAYKKRDLNLFSQYATRISEEAEKTSKGIYSTALPRDVFIAYSSKDMMHVSMLCEELEAQGISCFVAARNLRHGMGSVENYDDALKEAMDNCRCFVFVSSTNSRTFSCDAVTKEIPHIKSHDIANAPAHLRNNYQAIPSIYKKPRVEYRIGTEKSADAAAQITDAFFEGYEWVYDPKSVALRVAQQLYDAPVVETPADELQPPIVVSPKKVAAPTRHGKKKSRAPLVAITSLLLVGAITLGLVLVPKLTGRDPLDTGNIIDTVGSENAVDTNDIEHGFSPDVDIQEFDPWSVDLTEDYEIVENPSVGLEFQKIDKDICYISGLGTCTDTKLVLPSVSPEGDRVIGIADEAFAEKHNLISVDIPRGIAYIGEKAFYACSSLAQIDIPEGVTFIGDSAIHGINKLYSISFPSTVTHIGKEVIAACRQLERITVDLQNERYESIDNCLIDKNTKTLLAGCKTSVIPMDESIAIIDSYAFSGVTIENDIIIPDSVTRIEDNAFLYCWGIKSLSLPAGLQYIGTNAFGDGYWEKVTVSSRNTTYHSSGNCVIETATKTLVFGGFNATIPSDGSVTSIGDYAFYCNRRLGEGTTFHIPEGITTIGAYAFYGCLFTGLNLPDSLTSIGAHAFGSCYDLISVTLPPNLVSIDESAFWYCEALTELFIPGSVKQIGEQAFRGCGVLTSISVDPSNTVYHSDGNCLIDTASKTLIAGCNRSIIPTDGSVTQIGNYAFGRCRNIYSITIPGHVTSIGSGAFNQCESLTNVILEEGVVTIEAMAFDGCASLSSVTLPNSLTTIRSQAFGYCPALTSISFPNSLTDLASTVFAHSPNLTDIYYAGTEEQWAAITDEEQFKNFTSATIHFESTN